MRFLSFVYLSLATAGSVFGAHEVTLKYDQPAERWTEALPIGNGRLGAMIFGGVQDERLQLNESTLWSGGPREWNNPGARAVLPEIRAALLGNEYVRATQLAKKMQGIFTESYQPMGDLRLTFSGLAATADPSTYQRTLNLDRAVASVRYQSGGTTFTREVFASYPDQVVVVRISGDKPGAVSFLAEASSLLRFSVETDGADTLILRGRAPRHVVPSYWGSDTPIQYDSGPEGEGMEFEVRIRAQVVRREGRCRWFKP